MSGASVRLRPHGLTAAACCQTWSPDTTFAATRGAFGDPFLRVKRVVIPRDWSLSTVAEVLPAGSLFHLSCNRRSHARREAGSFSGLVRGVSSSFPLRSLWGQRSRFIPLHVCRSVRLTLSTRSCSLGVCSKLTFLMVCAHTHVLGDMGPAGFERPRHRQEGEEWPSCFRGISETAFSTLRVRSWTPKSSSN